MSSDQTTTPAAHRPTWQPARLSGGSRLVHVVDWTRWDSATALALCGVASGPRRRWWPAPMVRRGRGRVSCSACRAAARRRLSHTTLQGLCLGGPPETRGAQGPRHVWNRSGPWTRYLPGRRPGRLHDVRVCLLCGAAAWRAHRGGWESAAPGSTPWPTVSDSRALVAIWDRVMLLRATSDPALQHSWPMPRCGGAQ